MAPPSKLGRGKPFKNQTKELLHKLYRYFESEIKRDPNCSVTAAQLISHATGVSVNALRKVLSEYKMGSAEKKEYNPNRKRCKNYITSDGIDAQCIRRIIHSFYTKEGDFPSIKDLYLVLKADMDYQGSVCTLRKNLAKLGFKMLEKEDNSSVLIEKHEVRFARVHYLTSIERYRSQGINIVYTGEITIESCRSHSKPKSDGSSLMLKQPARSKLVILLAGDQQNLLKNAILMYDGNKREYKEEFVNRKENLDHYERWFKFNLIPNLQPGSVVVVDGGLTFHNRLFNPPPHSNSRKKEITDWLTSRGVPYSTEMYKPELYQLVLLNKDKYNDNKTELLLREHGHQALRLPACHPDLNPIKHILLSIKKSFGKDSDLNLESIRKIVRENIMSVTSEEWKHACRSAEAEENNLKAIDKLIDDISEKTNNSTVEQYDDVSEGDDDNECERETSDSE